MIIPENSSPSALKLGATEARVVQQGGLLPGLPPKATKANQYLIDAGYEMPKTIETWRQVLHHLMADFLAGEAAVDPKTDPKTGQRTCDKSYCELHSLCRVGELVQRQQTEQKNEQQEVST